MRHEAGEERESIGYAVVCALTGLAAMLAWGVVLGLVGV
jgi:hypothetical protein